jgi:excisionase family DNA binding protein
VREAAPAPAVPATSLHELRHVSPAHVAELLNLKEPYIHELCRTGKLPSTKKGKYWIIPVAGLREWLAYRKRDVDTSARAAGHSPDRPVRPAPFLRLRRPDGR